jgi:hypothetical protein
LVSKEAVTFLKKSNQKTFANWAPGGFTSTVQVSKSFLLLFFKKEALSYFPFYCHHNAIKSSQQIIVQIATPLLVNKEGFRRCAAPGHSPPPLCSVSR